MTIKIGTYTVEVMAADTACEDTSIREDTMRFLSMLEGQAWDALHYNTDKGYTGAAKEARETANAIHDKLTELKYFK